MQHKNENISETVRFSEGMIARMREHAARYAQEEAAGMVHSTRAKAHMAWRVAALAEWDTALAAQEKKERRGY